MVHSGLHCDAKQPDDDEKKRSVQSTVQIKLIELSVHLLSNILEYAHYVVNMTIYKMLQTAYTHTRARTRARAQHSNIDLLVIKWSMPEQKREREKNDKMKLHYLH